MVLSYSIDFYFISINLQRIIVVVVIIIILKNMGFLTHLFYKLSKKNVAILPCILATNKNVAKTRLIL